MAVGHPASSLCVPLKLDPSPQVEQAMHRHISCAICVFAFKSFLPGRRRARHTPKDVGFLRNYAVVALSPPVLGHVKIDDAACAGSVNG